MLGVRRFNLKLNLLGKVTEQRFSGEGVRQVREKEKTLFHLGKDCFRLSE